jgi:hypothetical protein
VRIVGGRTALEEDQRFEFVRYVSPQHPEGAARGLHDISKVMPGVVATADERDQRGCLD